MMEEFSDDTEFTEDNFGANTNQSNPPPLTRNGYTNPNGVVPNTGYLRKHIPQNNTLDETSSMNNNNNNKSKRRKIGSITQPTQNPGGSTSNNGNNLFSGTLGTRRRGNATNGLSSGANQTGPTHKPDHSDNNSVSNSAKPNANNENPIKRNSKGGKNPNKNDDKEGSKGGNEIPSVNYNCEVRDQDIGATVNWFNG
jgi:hypothetical protein